MQNISMRDLYDTMVGFAGAKTPESMVDPVGKFRVCTPQTMIDTDFEYSLQTTKWETIELVNNIPTFFNRLGDETIPVSDVQISESSFNVSVTTSTVHGLLTGSPFYISGVDSQTAEGFYVVLQKIDEFNFIYKARYAQTKTGSIFDSYATLLYSGRLFQSTQFTAENIECIETNSTEPFSSLTVKTVYPHGFQPSSALMMTNTAGIKEIFFDSAQVDHRNSLSYQYDINTLASVVGNSGYTEKSVVPYDWQSKSTTFFPSSAVNIANGTITIPSHNIQTGTYLMYAPPLSTSGSTTSAAVGGLNSFLLYSAVAVDSNTLSLREVRAPTPTVGGLRCRRIYMSSDWNGDT